jgi:hypothetical protein
MLEKKDLNKSEFIPPKPKARGSNLPSRKRKKDFGQDLFTNAKSAFRGVIKKSELNFEHYKKFAE